MARNSYAFAGFAVALQVPPTTPYFRGGQRRGFTFAAIRHSLVGKGVYEDAGKPYILGSPKTPRFTDQEGKLECRCSMACCAVRRCLCTASGRHQEAPLTAALRFRQLGPRRLFVLTNPVGQQPKQRYGLPSALRNLGKLGLLPPGGIVPWHSRAVIAK